MATRIKIRRGTTTQWNSSTKILESGELGLDTTLNKLKAGNGTSLWTALSYINILPSELSELAQDAVESAITAGTGIAKNYNDTANTITLSVDSTIASKTYVDTAVSGLGSTSAASYVPLSVVGSADGVASLDSDGKIPDSEIPAEITRNTLAQTLTNKTLTFPVIDNIKLGYTTTATAAGTTTLTSHLLMGDGASSEWYKNLIKAPWTPEGWVFGFAWTFLMTCFAAYLAKLSTLENSPNYFLINSTY